MTLASIYKIIPKNKYQKPNLIEKIRKRIDNKNAKTVKKSAIYSLRLPLCLNNKTENRKVNIGDNAFIKALSIPFTSFIPKKVKKKFK